MDASYDVAAGEPNEAQLPFIAPTQQRRRRQLGCLSAKHKFNNVEALLSAASASSSATATPWNRRGTPGVTATATGTSSAAARAARRTLSRISREPVWTTAEAAQQIAEKRAMTRVSGISLAAAVGDPAGAARCV
jgi:hypothetical protein